MLSPTDRRALGAVALQFFVNGAVFGSIASRLPSIRDQLDVSLATLGIALTAAGAAGLFGSTITSRVIERWSTRGVLVFGAALQVSLVALVGFSWHIAVFALAMAGISFVDVLVDVSMNLQASWLSNRRTVPVMNRLHGLWSLGGLGGGLIAAQLASLGVSLRAHLLGATVVLLIVLAYVGRGLLRVDEAPTREPAVSAKRAANPRPVAANLALFAVAGAAALAVEQISSEWSAIRLTDDLGAGEGAAGLAFAAFAAGMAAGRFSGDSIQTAIGRGRLFYGSCAVALAGVVTATFAPWSAAVYIGFVVAGMGVAAFFPMLYDDAAQAPGRTGAALSAMSAGSRGATLVTPTVVGALAAGSLGVGTAMAIAILPLLALLPVAHYLLEN